MRQTSATAIGLMISVATLPAVFSQQTLSERVREHGDLRLSSAPTFPVMDLTAVISESDLVVRAKVVSEHAHLSPDGRSVHTEFGLQPLAVLLQRHARRATPGPEPRLVVSVLGGEIVLDGHKVTWTDSSLRRFAIGKEYVLFLQENVSLNAYILAGHSNGAFEITGETVEPRLERDDSRREPVGLFIKRVQELIARGK